MIACAWLLSRDRKNFPWRTVIWGMALQFTFAIFILKTPVGLMIFKRRPAASSIKLNVFAIEGAQYGFGRWANADVLGRTRFGPGNSYVFAVSVSATIIVISALSPSFYHLGILQRVVAWHGLGHAESNAHQRQRKPRRGQQIFSARTEAALVIRTLHSAHDP